MTLPVPSHLVDSVGAATAAGVEAAGHLLQDVGHAVNQAASATTGRYRTIARSVRSGRRTTSAGRNFLVLAALAVLTAVVVRARRSKAPPTTPKSPTTSSPDTSAASAKVRPSTDATPESTEVHSSN